ncbi:MAG: hypothetical protein WDN06_10535 [Asticcacaulis sp.]
MDLARIIFFTDRTERLMAFYREHFALEVVTDEPEWTELRAGGCIIAFHAGGKGKPNNHTPKIAFKCADVPAMLTALIDKGIIPMGKLWTGDFVFSDGVDLDGNAFQISSC